MFKINLGCGPKLLEGFENLDIFKEEQSASIKFWAWGANLPFSDDSASLILIQHCLMYSSKLQYDNNFADIYRVLIPNGILILKEDNDFKYKWHSVGTHGIRSSTNLKEIIPILERNRFKILSTDAKEMVEKYGNIINRQKKLLKQKMFVIECEK